MILESKLEMGKWAIVFICNIINYSDDCLEIPLRLETILFCETNLTCHKPSLRDLSNEKPPSFWETTLTCHNPSLRDLSNEIPPSFWETTLTCHNPSLRDLSNEIPPSFWETTLTCHNPSLGDLSNEIPPSFGRPLQHVITFL